VTELKYCENCKWFVDGRDFYMPYARCANPVAVARIEVNLVRKMTHYATCAVERGSNGVCGVSAKLFESPELPPKADSALLRLWKYLFPKRREGGLVGIVPPKLWPRDSRDGDDIR
jgi:hypothetical protein